MCTNEITLHMCNNKISLSTTVLKKTLFDIQASFLDILLANSKRIITYVYHKRKFSMIVK